MNWTVALSGVQLFFGIVIGLYFWNLLRQQQNNRYVVQRESHKEMDSLRKLRAVSLTEPLAERTRPTRFAEIVGQEDGLRALRVALCSPHPQHVLIYGPPGVGKTAAARLVLEEAKKNPSSPFGESARFVEIDGATGRFDERGIADPLIGSVHDPIYQGAGAMGHAGIPQPKPGAVTKAHGGVLFIDEIGELHSIQMNKLLKVLEDRKVFLESSYYNSEDRNIPQHIHDIFQNGLPADFRLVGATTRAPEEIPAAIRSRCIEVYFRPLNPEQIGRVALNAAQKMSLELSPDALQVVQSYAKNGREAVNLIQIAAGLSHAEGKQGIEAGDMEWVVHSSQLPPRLSHRAADQPQIGVVNGLAVYGAGLGTLLEIEVTALPALLDRGQVTVTGVVEEEQMGSPQHSMRRKSMARSSVENVLTALRRLTGLEADKYDLHVNFPGGMPIDGPSAGIALAVAVYSAIERIPVDNRIALTGEVSIQGKIKPVGGTVAKVEAAREAGIKRVYIPRLNWQRLFQESEGMEIIPVDTIQQVFEQVFMLDKAQTSPAPVALRPEPVVAASLNLSTK